MTYINEKHRARFTLAVKNIAKANYALLSALYLLTADQRMSAELKFCKNLNIRVRKITEKEIQKAIGGNPL